MNLPFLELDGKSQLIDERTFDLDFIIFTGSVIILAECDCNNAESYWDTKKEVWQHILDNPQRLIKYVESCNVSSSTLEKIKEIINGTHKIFLLAVNDQENANRFSNLLSIGAKIWDSNTIQYFSYLSDLLREDSSKDFFYSLGIKLKDIDANEISSLNDFDCIAITSESDDPQKQMYVMWMSPKDLIKRSFVLRRDGWEIGGFQRMLITKKLKEIRSYILNSHLVNPFPTPIVISLNKREYPSIHTTEVEGKLKLYLPNDFNCFCIIDGQHRLYSFTQRDYANRPGVQSNLTQIEQEDVIMEKYYRTCKLPILCMIHDEEIDLLVKEQARLFSTINQTQTRIKSDLLYDIEEVINPSGDKSFASRLLKKLNSSGFFSKKFNIYFHEKEGLARTSILTWGFLPLVSKDANGSVYTKLYPSDQNNEEYLLRCTNVVNSFFVALKNSIGPGSIQSNNFETVASLNGFIRLIRHFVARSDFPIADIHNQQALIAYFSSFLSALTGAQAIDFEDESFHKSSHWGAFERELVRKIKTSHNDFGVKEILKKPK